MEKSKLDLRKFLAVAIIFVFFVIFKNQKTELKKELTVSYSYLDNVPLPIWNKTLKGDFIKVNDAYEFYVLDELNKLTGSNWNKNNIVGVNQFEVFGYNKNLDSVYIKDVTAYNSLTPLTYDEFITVEGHTYKFPMCIYKTGDSTIGGVALINFEDFKY